MSLLDDEKRLLRSDDGRVLVTSHRIRFEATDGSTRLISFTLDSLDCCEILHDASHSALTWAKITGLLAVVGLLLNLPGSLIPEARQITGYHLSTALLVVVAGSCYASYLLSRRTLVHFRSRRETISIHIERKNVSEAVAFIDVVERAKLEFLAKPRPDGETG